MNSTRQGAKVTSTQKGKQPRKHRSAGKPLVFTDMPLDILDQIFSLVQPLDLLRVSWTSKALRNFLTPESSRQVWIAAFDNIPKIQRPPPCPEILTEISYANLLYNPYCMGCGVSRTPAYWEALVRVCTNCIKNWVTETCGTEDKAAAALSCGEFSSLSQVLPTIYITVPPRRKRHYVLTKDLELLTTELSGTDDKASVVQRYCYALFVKNKLARVLNTLGSARGRIRRNNYRRTCVLESNS